MSCLDKNQIRRSFAVASNSYDGMASLQRKVGEQLIQYCVFKKGHFLDIGCGTGFFTEKLFDLEFEKELFALDIAWPMLLKTRERLFLMPLVCADAEQLPFLSFSMDTVVSNLALQWCCHLDSLFSDIRRVLQPEGSLIFSTFGEQSLCELKSAWLAVDDFPHVNDFYTPSELKYSLHKAGFKNIEIIKQTYMNEYQSAIDLMRELKGIGAHNVDQKRNRQLTSKGQLQKMLAAYPQQGNGKIQASFDILYVIAK